MFLRRAAGIHLVIFPTTSSATATSAAHKITHQAVPFTSSISTLHGFVGVGREFREDCHPPPLPPPSPPKFATILGKTLMTTMGGNKCKNYHCDHHPRTRSFHYLSSNPPSDLLVSSNNNSRRQFSWVKSVRDHNNNPLLSRTSSCKGNNNNFSSKSTNVTSSDSGDSGSSELIVTIKDGLANRESAEDFLNQLSDHQRQLIYHTLNIEVLRDKYEGTLGSSRQESHHYLSRFGRPATAKEDPTGTLCEVPSKWLHQRLDEKAPPARAADVWAVTVKNALPFIGFGFLDNLIMILAGDYIDITIGTALGISTMAAAALGNAISDVAGIGSAWYVEELASKIGIKDPDLTPSQMASSPIRWASNFGRAAGVMIGCILGMFPLLFLPKSESKERREKREKSEKEAKENEEKDTKETAPTVDKGKFT